MTHHVALKQKLTNCRGRIVEADVCSFSLSCFRLRKSELTLTQDTDELVAPLDLPHLALFALLYHEVKATSCQAKCNLFSLSVLVGTLRASMNPFKVVVKMVVLKLNQGYLSEVQKYNAIIAAEQERRS